MELIHKNRDILTDHFENLSEADIVEAYNNYASSCSYEPIHYNSEDFLNATYSSPAQAIKETTQCGYTYIDKFLQFDGYGHPTTSDCAKDFIDISEIVDHCMDNPENYDIEFIDPNDLSDEELFDYLKENRAFEGVPNSDEFSELWTREKLEEVFCDSGIDL